MARAGQLKVYAGIHELLTALHTNGHQLAIVTKSPDMVPRAFIKQHNWPIDVVVGYHDVKQRKPDPEGLLIAMAKGNAQPHETYHVGDQAQDTQASRGAGVIAIGATWGIDDHEELRASVPDYLFDDVATLTEFLLAR